MPNHIRPDRAERAADTVLALVIICLGLSLAAALISGLIYIATASWVETLKLLGR